MKRRVGAALAVTTVTLMAAMTATAAAPLAGALPGDRGRPGTGIYPPRDLNAPARPLEPNKVRTVPIELALKAAQAIEEGCKQYRYGLAVVNAEGVATLIYVPDRSAAWHGYSAVRKAFTAAVLKAPTGQLAIDAEKDTALADRVKADANLQLQGGGVPLKIGNEVIGAIGVSGAEPGAHDEECALIGVAKIKDQLK